MKTFVNNKAILAILGVLAVGMLLYSFLLGKDPVPTTGDLFASEIGTDLLKTRQKLQEVVLDRNIFSDDKFLQLSDFSADIPEQAIGRTNPFNVIGR